MTRGSDAQLRAAKREALARFRGMRGPIQDAFGALAKNRHGGARVQYAWNRAEQRIVGDGCASRASRTARLIPFRAIDESYSPPCLRGDGDPMGGTGPRQHFSPTTGRNNKGGDFFMSIT